MSHDNSLNPDKGRLFQKKAASLLEQHFEIEFLIDHPIPIGDPPKDHKFNLVSGDRKYIGECKNYSWTENGNIPSAKMGFVNEAEFYLSFLISDAIKFIVMRKDIHPKRNETLAEYYYRTYQHLLNDVLVIEIDLETQEVRKIN